MKERGQTLRAHPFPTASGVYEAVFLSAPDALLIVDERGTILEARS